MNLPLKKYPIPSIIQKHQLDVTENTEHNLLQLCDWPMSCVFILESDRVKGEIRYEKEIHLNTESSVNK